MQLFSDISRTDTAPASHGEDRFEYYNRSARVGVVNIRRLIQAWFDAYPRSEQAELAARFRWAFDSAYFELFLHELSRRLGYDVTVHPHLPSGISKRPDFGLTLADKLTYLEARVVTDENDAQVNERKIRATIFDQINALDIPDYFLILETLRLRSGTTPSLRRLKRELLQWIESLSYDETSRLARQSLDLTPRWTFTNDSVLIEIAVIPVSASHRGHPAHRPIGVYPMEASWGGPERSMRKALQRKSGKYGQLASPYVIALNVTKSFNPDRIAEMNALFGDEQFLFGPKSAPPQVERKRNGFWIGPQGIQNTRVSAVLICSVHPSNVHNAPACLYHNPWSKHPLRGSFSRLPSAAIDENGITWHRGVSFGELLGLEAGWLEE